MTKPSRSKRSQPEFDPNELDDLIFTPAVGTGVGSHLLTTVDRSDEATEAKFSQTEEIKQDLNVTTVVDSDTVVESEAATVSEMTTVAEVPTVGETATVVRFGPLPIWTTEDGQFVLASRVK